MHTQVHYGCVPRSSATTKRPLPAWFLQVSYHFLLPACHTFSMQDVFSKIFFLPSANHKVFIISSTHFILSRGAATNCGKRESLTLPRVLKRSCCPPRPRSPPCTRAPPSWRTGYLLLPQLGPLQPRQLRQQRQQEGAQPAQPQTHQPPWNENPNNRWSNTRRRRRRRGRPATTRLLPT